MKYYIILDTSNSALLTSVMWLCAKNTWNILIMMVIFPPVMCLVLDDPKQWPPQRLLIKFTSWSWKTARFRLNQWLSNWASHVSGLGPSFMKIWTCGSSPQSRSQNAWKRNGASCLSNFVIFSVRSKWFPIAIGDHGQNLVISLWPGDKATINGVAA